MPRGIGVAETSEIAASGVIGTSVDVRNANSYGVISTVTVSTPAGGVFTANAGTDVCTLASHGFKTGLKVQLTTTTTLPAPLLTGTDYFVIFVSASTFKLASSLVNAQAGTAIDITDTGTGVHTITPTSIAGASVKLQGSMDDSTWADLPIKASGDATKSANITVTANFHLNETDIAVNYIRAYYTLTAGQISVSQIVALDSRLRR